MLTTGFYQLNNGQKGYDKGIFSGFFFLGGGGETKAKLVFAIIPCEDFDLAGPAPLSREHFNLSLFPHEHLSFGPGLACQSFPVNIPILARACPYFPVNIAIWAREIFDLGLALPCFP